MKQVEQAEATFWAGAMLQLVSLVMKSLFLSLTLKVRGEGQFASTYDNVILLLKTTNRLGF